jgi:O-antigen ligase
VVFERIFTLSTIIINQNTIKFYPLDLLLIVVFIGWLFKANHDVFASLRQIRRLLLSVGIFFSIILLNLVRAFFVHSEFAVAFSTAKNIIFYSLIFFLFIFLINNQEKLKKLFLFFFLGISIDLILFIFSLITGQGFFTKYIPLSTYGTRYLGGGHSFYIIIAIIFILCFLIFSIQKKEKTFYWYWAMLFLGLTGISLSLLRHLWLGLILVLVFLFIFLKNEQRLKFGKILLIIGVLAVIAMILITAVNYWQVETGRSSIDILASIKLRFLSIFTASASDDSAIWRKEVWTAAYKLLLKHPVFGIGLGQKMKVELFNYESDIEVREMHNDYMALALQTGIVGLIFLAWFIIEIIRRFFSLYKEIDRQHQQYFLAGAGGILLYLFSANFGTYFDINLLVIFFWILLGIMINVRKYEI